MRRIAVVVLVLLVLFFMPRSLFAQTQKSGVSISPLTYNFEISPGESREAKITLKNLGNEEIDYLIETDNFTATTEDGVPVFAFGSVAGGGASLANWFEFPGGEEGKLAPNESTEISFKINVPMEAEPGGHYAAVFSKVIKKTDQGKTELGVSSRVGTLILVSVPGVVTRGMNIEELLIPQFVIKGPVNVGMKVKNTGSIHYDSSANLKIKSIFGSEVNVDLGTHTLLPSSTRIYEGKWENKYPFGIYKVTATANGGSDIQDIETTTVYAVPLVIALPLIVLIVILTITTRIIRRKYKVVAK